MDVVEKEEQIQGDQNDISPQESQEPPSLEDSKQEEVQLQSTAIMEDAVLENIKQEPLPSNAAPESVTQATKAEDSSDSQYAKQKHAMDFLYKVRVQYSNNPTVYNQFLEIMKDFKSGAIDTPEVITRVKSLFRGNDYLIREFNAFLPPGFKIEPDVEPPRVDLSPETSGTTGATSQNSQNMNPSGPVQQGDKADLEHARNYVRKIKNRFALQPHIYKQFLEILHDYYQAQHSINDVYEEVAELFQSHQDLLEEFRHFLPKSVGDNQQERQTLVPSQSRKGGKKKKQQPEREKENIRFMERERERPQRKAAQLILQEDKREKKERQTFFEEEERDVPKVERERPKRELQRAILPPPKRPFYYHERVERYVPRKGLGSNGFGLNKEFSFLGQAKRHLSKYLYQEFLTCVNLFSQDVLTKVEVLKLLRTLFQDNLDLYEKFKLFIAFDEPDPFEGKTEETLQQNYEDKQDDEVKEDEGDDEGVELTLMSDMNAATMRSFEMLSETATDLATARAKVEALDVIHLRCIERMYGERGSEVIEALHNNPLAVIPVVLKRLRQRNQEWSKIQVESEEMDIDDKSGSV